MATRLSSLWTLRDNVRFLLVCGGLPTGKSSMSLVNCVDRTAIFPEGDDGRFRSAAQGQLTYARCVSWFGSGEDSKQMYLAATTTVYRECLRGTIGGRVVTRETYVCGNEKYTVHLKTHLSDSLT